LLVTCPLLTSHTKIQCTMNSKSVRCNMRLQAKQNPDITDIQVPWTEMPRPWLITDRQLYLVKNSICFGQIYCPSSVVLILYSQQYVFVKLVMLPSATEVSQDGTPDSWWWTVNLSKTRRVLYQIKLRNSASHWLLL